ncbi:MAG: hypothetical protein WA924_02280 [Burkholderiaceae bacterium]
MQMKKAKNRMAMPGTRILPEHTAQTGRIYRKINTYSHGTDAGNAEAKSVSRNGRNGNGSRPALLMLRDDAYCRNGRKTGPPPAVAARDDSVQCRLAGKWLVRAIVSYGEKTYRAMGKARRSRDGKGGMRRSRVSRR